MSFNKINYLDSPPKLLAISDRAGFVYDAAGAVTLDPDRQIQNAMRMLFETFRQTGSANATVRRFQRERLPFPHRMRGTPDRGEIRWLPLEHPRILHILHNPRYAGAFAFGRTRVARTKDLKSTTQIHLVREEWMVLIKDAHAGYISWEEFERNQVTLKQNLAAYGSGASRGALPREGSALLQGHVICGRCGSRMRTRYQKDQKRKDHLRKQQFERARYEAELKRRRFLKCNPEHRLVADALEADWNEALRRLDGLQQDHERQRQADQGLLSDDARARILALSRDFPRVWNDSRIEARDRKRMLALLIEDVTLLKGEEVAVHVRFRGGQTTSLTVQAPKTLPKMRKFKPEVIQQLDQRKRVAEAHGISLGVPRSCATVGSCRSLTRIGGA